MKKQKHTPFYVIHNNFTTRKFEKYDVMPYLISCYKEIGKKDRPNTFDECKTFIESKSRYMYWARCEYEIVLYQLVGENTMKVDIHWQLMHNIDIVTIIFMKNVGIYKKIAQDYLGVI